MGSRGFSILGVFLFFSSCGRDAKIVDSAFISRINKIVEAPKKAAKLAYIIKRTKFFRDTAYRALTFVMSAVSRTEYEYHAVIERVYDQDQRYQCLGV